MTARHPADPNDPYPDDDEGHDCCDHLDYESDILTGRATCACGHSWYQTSEEIARERRLQAEYDQQCKVWEREQRSVANRLRALVARVRSFWSRPVSMAGDEIPF